MSLALILPLLVLLTDACFAPIGHHPSEYEERRRLTRALLKNYDRFLVPSMTSNKPVNVTITMWPYDILQVSEAKSSVKFSGWLDLRWIDPSIQWKPEEHMNISHLVIPASQLWLPSIDIFYSKDESRAKDCKDCYVKIDSNGETLWGQYFSFSFPCTINVRYFPFDLQYCEMELANWYLDDLMMDLYPRDSSLALDLSVFLPNVEWALINVTVTRKREFFNYGFFPSIAYRLYIKRKPFYYVTNLVVPTLIITLTAVIGLHFPSSGAALHQEKVQMGVTAVLSTFILQLGIADKLPRTNDVVPLIGIYYSCMVMILSLSIVSSGLIIYVEKQGIYGQPIPDVLQLILLRRIKPNRHLKEPQHDKASNGMCESESHNQARNKGRYAWSTFVRNYGTIAPIELPRRDISVAQCDCNATYRYFPGTNGTLDEVWRKQRRGKRSSDESEVSSASKTTSTSKSDETEFEKSLSDIRSSLTRLEDELEEKARQERIRRDWSELADVVERLSLLFFVSAALSCLILFFNHEWWY